MVIYPIISFFLGGDLLSYIFEELKRAFWSPAMLIASLLSIFMFIGGFIEYISWLPSGQLSLLYLFLSGYNSGTANTLALAFPILACLPFVASYVQDENNHLTNYISIRTSERTYKTIKFFITGLTGGVAVAIGPVVGFMILSVLSFVFQLPLEGEGLETAEMFHSMGIASPHLMILLIILTIFGCGFTLASFGLGLSVFVKNTYLAVLMPFVFYLITSTIFIDINPLLNAQILYDINKTGMGSWPRVAYAAILIIIGAVSFFGGGRKIEYTR
ncbi:hypothetical protein ABID49_002397 [Bhargavaea ullalensis]|uniref:ABC-2 family transporter protein n=2 Tax=Bhargavaea ullalensis TaxID=1265685 RepID=A0ABV2GDV5_9BACL